MSKPEPMQPTRYYPPCVRHELVVAPMLGWNHAGKLLSYALNAGKILEYGSGGSTLWLAQHCPQARIVSIEHDFQWTLRIQLAATVISQDDGITLSPQLKVHLAEFGVGNEDAYVHHPSVDCYRPYDLIFIDGAHTTRTPCLKAACDLLTLGGVVLLDNSEEPAYQEGKAFLLAQPGMVLIEETEDDTWDSNRSHRHLWIAQKREPSPA